MQNYENENGLHSSVKYDFVIERQSGNQNCQSSWWNFKFLPVNSVSLLCISFGDVFFL